MVGSDLLHLPGPGLIFNYCLIQSISLACSHGRTAVHDNLNNTPIIHPHHLIDKFNSSSPALPVVDLPQYRKSSYPHFIPISRDISDIERRLDKSDCPKSSESPPQHRFKIGVANCSPDQYQRYVVVTSCRYVLEASICFKLVTVLCSPLRSLIVLLNIN